MVNKGSTFAEVLLSLFILSVVIVSFGQFNYHIQRLNLIEVTNEEMSKICKDKIEEIKTGRIYIEEKEYFLSEFNEDTIDFKEKGYDVNISIKRLVDNKKIHYINIYVNKDKYQYNMIRYFDFDNITFPIIYEELEVDSI